MIEGFSAIAEEKVLNLALSSLREYKTVKAVIWLEKHQERALSTAHANKDNLW